MAVQPGIKVRYKPVRLPTAKQLSWVGAQTVPYQRGWWKPVQAGMTGIGAGGSFLAQLGDLLCVAGQFDTLGGVPSPNFGAIRISDGAGRPEFSHTFASTGAFSINCVATDGTFVYVGGDFTSVDGVSAIASRPIGSLVRFDYYGNLDTTWNPSLNQGAGLTPSVLWMSYNRINKTLLIACGNLSNVNGVARNFVSELSLNDAGNATSWNPNPNAAVNCITFDPDAGLAYLGGAFTTIQGGAAVRLVRMTMAGAGAVDATWLPAPNNVVDVVRVLDGAPYAGGIFTVAGANTLARNRAASFDQLGNATSWNPNCDAAVLDVQKYRDVVFLAGSFTHVGGTARNGLAAVTDIAGALLVWDAAADAATLSLALIDRTLYAAGNFTTLANGSHTLGVANVNYPIFTDTNTIHVAKTGSDSNGGGIAAPVLTITHALSLLAGALTYVLVMDSGVYDEYVSVAYSANEAGGIFAVDGQAPTITRLRGAQPGTFGARKTGRTKFSGGAPNTFYYVSKLGNDGTGARGNPALPFLTIGGAISDGARVAGDTIQIQDSGTYNESPNFGAVSGTLQAANGQVPVILGSVSANADLNMYGISIDILSDFSSDCIGGQNINLYDCTTSGGLRGCTSLNNITGVVVGCLFYRSAGPGLDLEGGGCTWTVTDTVIQNCNYSDFGNKAGLYFAPSGGAGTNSGITVRRCSFLENDGVAQVWVRIANTNKAISIRDCLFRDNRDTPRATMAFKNTMTGTGTTFDLEDCEFVNQGGSAVVDTSNNTAGPVKTYTNLVAQNCARVSKDQTFGTLLYKGGMCTFLNCISLGSGGQGFVIQPGANVSASGTCDHCVALGSALNGYYMDQGAGNSSIAIVRSAEYGSGSHGIILVGAITVFSDQYNVIATPISAWVFGIGSIAANPLFLSTVAGNENAAVSALSPCLLHDGAGGDVGLAITALATLVSANHRFAFDGIIFTAAINWHTGIGIAHALPFAHAVSWCTFSGLGAKGIDLYSGAQADHCLMETNGIGLALGDAEGGLMRMAASTCGGAAVVALAPNASMEHVTAFACEYGQADGVFGGNSLLRDNVFSGNAVLDYSGAGTQDHSDVVNLSGSNAGEPIASVTNGTRRDPLFRDVRTPDLRLQVTEAGFPYDSPAKGLAHDGKDAGAFDFYYPPVLTAWTTIDLAALGLQGSGNPDNLETENQPYKLVEGNTFGGRTFSDAPGFKREWTLTWRTINAMADALRDALIDLYTSGDGESQVSFDGGATFIPTRIIRSTKMTRKQLEGLLYTRTEIPEPIGTLVLRESV